MYTEIWWVVVTALLCCGHYLAPNASFLSTLVHRRQSFSSIAWRWIAVWLGFLSLVCITNVVCLALADRWLSASVCVACSIIALSCIAIPPANSNDSAERDAASTHRSTSSSATRSRKTSTEATASLVTADSTPTARVDSSDGSEHPAAHKKRSAMLCCSTLLLVLAAALLAGLTFQAVFHANDVGQVFHPLLESGRLIAVHSESASFMFIKCSGFGPQTVLLEAGTSFDSVAWTQVFEQLEHAGLLNGTIRACAYDRVGYGLSRGATTSRPRTRSESSTSREIPHDDGTDRAHQSHSELIAKELYALLDAAQVSRPFIFVGWSFGALVGMSYAQLYPTGTGSQLAMSTRSLTHSLTLDSAAFRPGIAGTHRWHFSIRHQERP